MKSLFSCLLLLTVCAASVLAEDKKESVAVEGNNAFAVDLYGKLSRKGGNIFYSPVSLSTALAMTAGGARGETAMQMAKVLHLPTDARQRDQAVGELLRQLKAQGKSDKFQLHIANALWGQQGFGFLPDFLQSSKKEFGAELREIDFHDATAAAKIINAWVEAQTQDKIKDLLQPGVIHPETKLILTNAIYFKSAWANPFAAALTKPQDFHVAPDQAVQAPMMHQKEFFRLAEEEGFQTLELPYAGRDATMLVFLPRTPNGLAKLEASLGQGSLNKTLSHLKRVNVDVFLPKFKVESEFRLRQILEGLGMPLAFSRNADFSGMSGSPELAISEVVHKAFVDVNEQGTEAAAATAVVMMRMSVAVGPEATFRADHPFLFMIRDARSGSILFQGRVTNPKG
jgi:serpin B